MELRNYQAATISGLFLWWKENGNDPAVCVLPTAAGKTVIFSALIKELFDNHGGRRILILSHTKELVSQARDKLKAFWPDAPVGVYAAGLNEKDTHSKIISASRDSIANKLDQFEPFDLVIIDEAHLINNKNEGRYRKILDDVLTTNADASIVGFTATPYRSGANGGFIYGKDRLFSGVAYEAKMIELMKAGYLCKVVAKVPDETGIIDTSKVKTRAGDFALNELSQVSECPYLVRAAVADWKHKAYDRGRKSTCFFAVSIAHAEMIQLAISDLGIECGLVTGKTCPEDRDLTLKRFDSGELEVIVNVAVLTTGWDAPRLNCIALLRPTKSIVLYLQIVGRGLRLHPSKTETLVLDYGGNLERFGPIDQATPVEKKKGPPKTQICEECESIISFYAYNCEFCGHELKEKPRKVCDLCGTFCAPSCTKCPSCGSLFLTHQGQCEMGEIISTEDDIREFAIEQVTTNIAMARKSGRYYMQVWFWASIETKFCMNVFIGYPGTIGIRANAFYEWITQGNFPTPANPGHAVKMFNSSNSSIRKIAKIQVDFKSKYKDIIKIIPRGYHGN